MRALLTCRPLAGHYRPMLPLARSLAKAGHDVAFASGEPVVGEAEAEGFTAFRVGLAMDSAESLARRARGRAASLHPSQVRSFVFTELFVRVELEPRAHDLFNVVEHWSPHLVVHDVAEFAAPLVATVAGIPYVEHSYGPAVQNDVVRAAGKAAAPFWELARPYRRTLSVASTATCISTSAHPASRYPERLRARRRASVRSTLSDRRRSPRGSMGCAPCRSSTSR